MGNDLSFETGVIRPIECYREAWQFIKPNYWLFFAVSMVGLVIGGATLYVLLGAMVCGIFYCFLAALDGNEPQFEDLFKGIGYWKPGLLVLAVIIIPTMIVFAVVYLPLLAATLMGGRLNEQELYAMLAGTFAVEAVLSVLMVCLHTLLMFAFPLIVDKNLSGWDSIVASAKAVWGNLGGVTGLWAFGFLVSLVGYLLFCVGIYLTIPVVIAANAVAYRKVFPGSFSPDIKPMATS